MRPGPPASLSLLCGGKALRSVGGGLLPGAVQPVGLVEVGTAWDSSWDLATRSYCRNRGRQTSTRVSESNDSFSVDRHKSLDFRDDRAHTYLMDTTAHRILKQARDLLVSDLNRDHFQRSGPSLTDDQVVDVQRVANALWRLMNDDPSPPECQNCATGITQAKTGRPRRYCSDACRSADHRAKSSRPDHDAWGTGLKDGGF